MNFFEVMGKQSQSIVTDQQPSFISAIQLLQ